MYTSYGCMHANQVLIELRVEIMHLLGLTPSKNPIWSPKRFATMISAVRWSKLLQGPKIFGSYDGKPMEKLQGLRALPSYVISALGRR